MLCNDCKRGQRKRSYGDETWTFANSLFDSKHRAINAAVREWGKHGVGDPVSDRELDELQEWVGKGVEKGTGRRAPSLEDLGEVPSKRELRDILGQPVESRRSRSQRKRRAARVPDKAAELAEGIAELDPEEYHLDDILHQDVDTEVAGMSFDELTDYLDRSPNENTFFEQGLRLNADSTYEALQQFVYYAMRHDLRQKLRDMGVEIR